jgi:hypothetical protein
MKKRIRALSAPLLVLFAAQGVHAQTQTLEPPPYQPVHFLFGIGVSGGGDKLASGQYKDGRTVDLRAGGALYLSAGVDYRLLPAFSLQGTINYHVDDASVWNGDFRFERYPIELIGYFQPDPAFRVGGGIRYTVSPKLSSNGKAPEANTSFDNARSAVVEAEYFAEPDMGIKLRYVHETFKERGREIDGSHVGMSVNFYF